MESTADLEISLSGAASRVGVWRGKGARAKWRGAGAPCGAPTADRHPKDGARTTPSTNPGTTSPAGASVAG
eukprot:5963907-Lingulodinium_polyedra.AAC.1